MLERKTEPTTPRRTGFCPHLGIREDAHTCLGYPAEWNLCYHAKPVAAVSLEQQRDLCLSPVYMHCPVFRSEQRAPLPKALRGAHATNLRKWALLAATLVLVALSLWVAWQNRTGKGLPLLGSVALPFASCLSSARLAAPAASPTSPDPARPVLAALPLGAPRAGLPGMQAFAACLLPPLWPGLAIVPPLGGWEAQA